MSISDRRSGKERRTTKRHGITADVTWRAGSETFLGTISDISRGGCFILCSGSMNEGEIVSIDLPIGDGLTVPINGRVNNPVFEIGFAVEFLELTYQEAECVDALVRARDQV